MNTKIIIGAIVGGFLVFFWQFLSWTMLNLHSSSQKYTSNQDSVLAYLGTHLADEGTYFLPTLPKEASKEDYQKLMETSSGKPWAQISYHKSMNASMGTNMLRGLLADIVAVLLLCWLLAKISNLTLQTAVFASIAVGIVGYLTTEYAMSIWYQVNSMPHLLDAVVSWGLCGTWLGYWLKR
jgi:uncharacterized membrane protein YeaQ/YmgE (transglycosylase-associated protein family)